MQVAIKRIDNLFDDSVDSKRILREVCLLRQLNHPNLVKMIEIAKPRQSKHEFNTLYIVTEFFGRDLSKRFMETGEKEIKDVKLVSYQMLLGYRHFYFRIDYLHRCSVLHRDLKPANILIENDTTTKICDFGLARSFVGVMPPLYETDRRLLEDEEKQE